MQRFTTTWVLGKGKLLVKNYCFYQIAKNVLEGMRTLYALLSMSAQPVDTYLIRGVLVCTHQTQSICDVEAV